MRPAAQLPAGPAGARGRAGAAAAPLAAGAAPAADAAGRAAAHRPVGRAAGRGQCRAAAPAAPPQPAVRRAARSAAASRAPPTQQHGQYIGDMVAADQQTAADRTGVCVGVRVCVVLFCFVLLEVIYWLLLITESNILRGSNLVCG